MFIIHEGEIIFKEKYGSSSRERFYVKPPAQGNIVVLDEEKSGHVTGLLTKIFLPQGYPDSVSKDYLSYQIWDTAQAFCSSITGTLATQEVLRGVGVGDTTATPLAATVTWVIKDGCGHLGRILFAFSHGSHLDAYSKKWRLYADTLNDAAMCIEIALPYFKNYITFALCVSTVMKAIVGVAGGATRVAMTQHHAIRGNLADVSAKDSAQETAVNLVASFAALLIITMFGNSLFIFITMLILHIAFNYFAVRAVCLRTMNEPRFLQVIHQYLGHEVIAAPCEINRNEPIILNQMGPNRLDMKLCGFEIKLGNSMKKPVSQHSSATYLKNIKEVYDERSYILVPNIHKRKMNVLIKEDADTDDILCAYFHATLLSIITSAINDHTLPLYKDTETPRPFAQVCHAVQSAEWSRDTVHLVESQTGFVYEPSVELMKYVDVIVHKEWQLIRAGLIHTGWDLSKHLLSVDEWRICVGKKFTQSISADKIPQLESLIDTGRVTSFLGVNIPTTEEDEDEEQFTIEPEGNKSQIFKPDNTSAMKVNVVDKTEKPSSS